ALTARSPPALPAAIHFVPTSVRGTRNWQDDDPTPWIVMDVIERRPRPGSSFPLDGRKGTTMNSEFPTKEATPTRRNLRKGGAGGVLGAAAASAIKAPPAWAADGDPIILGQENFAL